MASCPSDSHPPPPPGHVPCPVCKGAGQLSYQPRGGCTCCQGKGLISAQRAEVLTRIRTDLTNRLLGA